MPSNEYYRKNISLRKYWETEHYTRDDGVTVLPDPIIPLIDEKKYKSIRLPNGLTALLISDPNAINQEVCDENDKPSKHGSSMENSHEAILTETDLDSKDNKVYCSLAVNVGYFSDPVDLQGLAHFVEHLLFMGSEKYPGNNDFFSYIAKNFGISNAMTQAEITTYYFGVARDKLYETLDIFSQFFISPLFDKGSIQNEIGIIDSEYQLRRKGFQLVQIYNNLYPSDHPKHRFGCGNIKTLKDNIDNETLHRSAIEFWKRHYSADRMTLVLQGGYDINTLEQYVVNLFGEIKNNGLPPDDFSQYEYNENIITRNYTKIYYIKPNLPTNELRLSWILPTKFAKYTENPIHYLRYMISQSNKGGLEKYLKSKNWIDKCHSYADPLTVTVDLQVIITLTKEGLKHIDQIVESFFSYMEMLKREKPSKRIFNEIKTVRFSKFSYPDTTFQGIQITHNMIKCKPEHYLTCAQISYNFAPDLITELYEYINPKTMNIIIHSTEFDSHIEYNLEEKWYGGHYKEEDIPSSWMKRWLNVEKYPYFKIPKKNEYITNNFDLKPPPHQYKDRAIKFNLDLKTAKLRHIYDAEDRAKSMNCTKLFKKDDLLATVNFFRLDQPNLFRKDEHTEMWYKPIYKSKLPITIIFILMLSPVGLENPKRFCIFNIWKAILTNTIMENTFDAQFAGLRPVLATTSRGLLFKYKGYSQKLPKFVENTFRLILSKSFNQNEFELARTEIKQSITHSIKAASFYIYIYEFLSTDPMFDRISLYKVVDSITQRDIVKFHKEYFQHMYLKIMVLGNTAWYEAMDLSQCIQDIIGYQPFDVDRNLKPIAYKIPAGNNILRIKNLNKKTRENLVCNFYQGDVATAEDEAVLEIIQRELKPYLFNLLRTKQQLSYGVMGGRAINVITGYEVTINPTKKSTSFVDSAIDAAIRNFSLSKTSRRTMTSGINTPKLPVKELILMLDEEILDRSATNFWGEIANGRYDFQRIFKVRKALLHLKLSQVMEWYNKYFPVDNSQYSKLSIQIVGTSQENVTDDDQDDETEDLKYEYLTLNEPVTETVETDPSAFIKDIYTFKKSLKTFDIEYSKKPRK